jgi:predicted RNA-binding protein (virulence factor B family)
MNSFVHMFIFNIWGVSIKQVLFANIAAATLRSLWCTFVQSLLVVLEGTNTICRQSNHVYASSCVFKLFKKIEKPATCDMRSVIHFLNARNMKPADIHRQLHEVCGKHAMIDSMVRIWVRHFNE